MCHPPRPDGSRHGSQGILDCIQSVEGGNNSQYPNAVVQSIYSGLKNLNTGCNKADLQGDGASLKGRGGTDLGTLRCNPRYLL